MEWCIDSSMKMHSYTMTNVELRKIWEAKGRPKHKNENEYPNNINFFNFTLFMWMPVLVYETQYPRTERIRKRYIIRKGAYIISILYLDYLIVSEYILPVLLHIHNYSVVQSIYAIMLPMFAFCMLTFFLVFENMLNFFAEITRFADRLFYQDW
jgi:sterol O-acyltransferase